MEFVIDDIQLKRATAAAWTALNPVLLPGEPGVETDTRKTKIGDGVTAWNSLSYSVATPDTHNHDAAYAALNHNHDASYATAGHNHNATYASLGHNHDATYAKADGSTGTVRINYGKTGELVVSTGVSRFYPPRDMTITKWEMWVGVAPVGANIIASLNINGVASETMTLTAGTNYASATVSAPVLASDYLTIDFTQVGTTTKGSEVSIRLTGA